jgi:hypothetical protein
MQTVVIVLKNESLSPENSVYVNFAYCFMVSGFCHGESTEQDKNLKLLTRTRNANSTGAC